MVAVRAAVNVSMSKQRPVTLCPLRGWYGDWHFLKSLLVTRAVGLTVPSASLPTPPSCVASDALEGRDAIQRDLDSLETWNQVNLTKYKAKCKVPLLGKGNPKFKHRLGREWIESSSQEKDLGMLVDDKLNGTHQQTHVVPKAKRVLGCTKSSAASRVREVSLPLFPALMRPQQQCCIQLWGPQHRKDTDMLEFNNNNSMDKKLGCTTTPVYQDKLRKVVMKTNTVATVPFRSLISFQHHTCLCSGSDEDLSAGLAPKSAYSSSSWTTATQNVALTCFAFIMVCQYCEEQAEVVDAIKNGRRRRDKFLSTLTKHDPEACSLLIMFGSISSDMGKMFKSSSSLIIGNENEWDRGQEQTPIKAVEYHWQMEHTEQLINPFLGWYHVGDDEFDNCNSCITGILQVMHNTAVIPILRETEL
ncbi:hypothetical protein DUI87_16111 [Hirundo rustica rustica]|uniref:Uncharacterized protein n=1 Tax=Hirundo rustica rustica TaxID=333673 RepID=A0A3M0K0C7_HIRRU|nr:hypothetical protein DUI87_16111 [Hirundo rustica rustica]